MNLSFWLPFFIPVSSLVGGVLVMLIRDENRRLRTAVNLCSASLKVLLVAYMVWGVARGETYRFSLPLFRGFELVLHADALSLLFAGLSASLWLVTTFYAIGYLEGSPNRRRFFGFFSLCVSATTGIALAGNLFTYLVFYESLTVATYPLIVHRATPEVFRAGRVYLAYTLCGGALLLVSMVWLSSIAGAAPFQPGGSLAGLEARHHGALRVLFTMLIIGFGVKAALAPLHGWLPVAMIAPAPVSALLHAVAVVKAGVFGIVRVVLDVYGLDFCSELGVLFWLRIAAVITILYGSLRALYQDDLKRRLAYSTISQLSYITLGVASGSTLGIVGGLVHLIHQGIMKITMFFCAGNLNVGLGVSLVSRMNGVGRRMPLTMAAFTTAAVGMIGLPPMAGFITKWYIACGAVDAGRLWIIAVLVLSSLLNAAYFLPIVYRAWFRHPDVAWQAPRKQRWDSVHGFLLVPPLITAGFTLAVGLFAGLPYSPLYWVRVLVEGGYVP